MTARDGSPGAQLQRRLHDAAAAGDERTTETLLKGGADADCKDENGWTSLMLAARNGHGKVIRRLLDAGCDRDALNGSGQKALDIAVFWNHHEAAVLLGDCDKDHISLFSAPRARANFYCGGHLDRCAHKHKDPEWLEAKFHENSTCIIVFIDLKPVVTLKNSSVGDVKSEVLHRFSPENIAHLSSEITHKVFLGTGSNEVSDVNSNNDIAWFAVNLSNLDDGEKETLLTTGKAEVIEPLPGSMHLVRSDSAIFAQARTMLAWQDRYQHCASCGAMAKPTEGGNKMTCSDVNCRSRKGVHNTSYPRSDPSVIMAVISRDRKRLLLGRGARFPRGMYSCLAGFMEPGESIEDACRREVQEESGVDVGHVQYHSSAPWPFPASLMIGCLAFAESEDIKVDADELEDARWFCRSDVLKMLHGNHPEGLCVPPEQAIAHVLIRAWVNMASNL